MNITINTVDTSITTAGNNLSANLSGATYQWVDCNAGFAALSGETNQSYFAPINGDYAVIITNNGCTDTSRCEVVLTTAKSEIENPKSEISIYPNPSNGMFQILSTTKMESIKLLTILGKEIITVEPFNNQSTININQCAKGIYFVEIKTTEGIRRRKIIVQ